MSNVAGFLLIFTGVKLNAMTSKSRKYKGCDFFSFSMYYQEDAE